MCRNYLYSNSLYRNSFYLIHNGIVANCHLFQAICHYFDHSSLEIDENCIRKKSLYNLAMPIDRHAGLQLGLLLLAVPAQYIFTQWFASSESQRTYAIKSLLDNAVVFKDEYLSWRSWKKWCARLIHGISSYSDHPYFEGQDDPNGESPAVEVINHKDPKGYFAGSSEPREIRPPEVKFRIGQVIKHKRWGYRGVIVGWDEHAKAPDFWLKHNHPRGKEHWRVQPNYSILVDTRDRLSPQVTYVPQENIDIIINTQVLHPNLEDYFEAFDGAQYLPRPWLKALYPRDS